jgi:hypothetical protein
VYSATPFVSAIKNLHPDGRGRSARFGHVGSGARPALRAANLTRR